MTAEGIRDELLLYQVDASAEHRFELLAHSIEVRSPGSEVRLGIGERDEDIDIAIGTELIGEHGAEQCELKNYHFRQKRSIACGFTGMAVSVVLIARP